MEHLDEGMVHAWLDDALPAEQARDIATHVQSCVSCAALVAEARGFIAASTRIVAQLDHVSANVIPENIATVGSRGHQRRRTWWQHPGFAAAAVLGVTTLSWLALRDDKTIVAPAAAPVVATAAPIVAEPAKAIPTPTSLPASTPTSTPQSTKHSGAAPAPTNATMSRDAKARAITRGDAAVSTAVAEGALPRAEALAVPMAAPLPLTMRARGANTLTAVEREATPTGFVGCYTVSRAHGDDAKSAGPPFADLPSSIQLTDSAATTSGAETTFVAYGRSSVDAAAQSLRWRAIEPNVFALARGSDPDAPMVRVVVGAFTGAAYLAHRTSCP